MSKWSSAGINFESKFVTVAWASSLKMWRRAASGLEGIRERARLLGGKATIETKLGQGTQVVVELPIVLRRPEDAQPGDTDW